MTVYAPPHQFDPLESYWRRVVRRFREGLPVIDNLSDRCSKCYLPRINHPVSNTTPRRAR